MIEGEWIPLAVSLHIPCETFYSLTPKKLLRYAPYYSEAIKQERREVDEHSWLGNVYTYKAVAASLYGNKAKYPQKPLDFYGLSNQGDEQLDYNGEPLYEDAKKMLEWANAFNKQHFGNNKESEVV